MDVINYLLENPDSDLYFFIEGLVESVPVLLLFLWACWKNELFNNPRGDKNTASVEK